MIKLYNKIDKNILTKAPFNWIVGWHKFLPIIAILALFSIVIGFMFPTINYGYYRNNGLSTVSVFLGFLSFMVFILYVIRQLKFNSFRIHHHIPFAKSTQLFFSFWIIIFLLSSIAFIPHHIHTWKVKKHINSITNNFKDDTETLYNGGVFFETNYYGNAELLYDDSVVKEVTKHRPKQKFDLYFNEDTVTINDIHYRFGTRYYNFNRQNDKPFKLPVTISNDEAIKYIKNFITIASKYDIKLVETNAEEVFKKRKAFIRSEDHLNFSLFASHKTMDNPIRIGSNYDSMMQNYQRQFDKVFKIEEVLGILIFSIILAMLLWIVISVPIADFGYSVLVSVILMVFMGVLAAMLNLISSNDFVIRLVFYGMIFLVYFLAFISKKETRFYRVLKIVSHYLVAVFLFLIFLEIEEFDIIGNHRNEFYVFCAIFLGGMVLSVFMFKEVYKKYRLLPK